VCTAVIGDIAGHLGCFIFLKDSVNAIAFVALGTSVPGIKKIGHCSKFLFAAIVHLFQLPTSHYLQFESQCSFRSNSG